ncbi:MAG TPA: cell envelope integrity protein CreD [Xanthobacteraceae bacterium]|jgi:inner membrane protein|nr:cell envelope integrity protein CreD [Xanthobacteraceae bacterium]
MGDIFNAHGFKVFLIGLLTFILLIPTFFVRQLIEEREQRAESVRGEIAGLWGGSQFINGPVLIVPYVIARTVTVGERRTEELIEQRAVFLPETLNIKVNAASRVLYRSIFEQTVYSGTVALEGRFNPPEISDVAPDIRSVRWRDAVLAIGINDVSGLRTPVSASVNGAPITLEPSIGVPSSRSSGIHLKLASLPGTSDATGPLPGFGFKLDFNLNGSAELLFAPTARETTVELMSDWPHPSFTGAFLPAERRIGPDGFSARWQVPHLARSLPQSWAAPDAGLERIRPYAFGAKFFVPVDHYKQVTRAAKYAVMFLGIAFIAVFLIELKSPLRIHPVQYLFAGFAMVFFFVLLLSLSEHIGFAKAYALSATATGGMLSVYVGVVQHSAVKGAIMALVFGALYALLYMILRLEDYALLAGALLGFVLITVTMFATLKVEWNRTLTQASADRGTG